MELHAKAGGQITRTLPGLWLHGRLGRRKKMWIGRAAHPVTFTNLIHPSPWTVHILASAPCDPARMLTTPTIHQSFHPKCSATAPAAKDSTRTPQKPASSIMPASARFEGNLRIDSTRYW